MPTLTIARRYRGPEESGNGGYTCGLVAGFIDGPAEVTLRKPPPLDRPLDVELADGGVRVLDGSDLVAEGRPAEPGIDVPEPPSMGEAVDARRRYTGYRSHAFPTCFVCGTERADDGMMIHAGQIEGRELWASPFRFSPSLPNAEDAVAPEMVWAALDCPGAWAVERATHDRPVVLGRMTARLERPAPMDRDYMALGWPIGEDGRKLFSGTALFDADGNRYGHAGQIWFVVEG